MGTTVMSWATMEWSVGQAENASRATMPWGMLFTILLLQLGLPLERKCVRCYLATTEGLQTSTFLGGRGAVMLLWTCVTPHPCRTDTGYRPPGSPANDRPTEQPPDPKAGLTCISKKFDLFQTSAKKKANMQNEIAPVSVGLRYYSGKLELIQVLFSSETFLETSLRYVNG